MERMRHRVRAAGLCVDRDRVLLVLHRHPQTGEEWWVPPGGGGEQGDADLFDTARREMFEETGLHASPARIAYVREFRETSQQCYHLELFISVETWEGQLTTDNLVEGDWDSEYVVESRWMSRAEMIGRTVYPIWLKEDWFWEDARAGFPETRYVGVAYED